jgi:hypothetical protein
MSIFVRQDGHVVGVTYACQDDVESATTISLAWTAEHGGSVSTVRFVVPERRERARTINTAVHLYEDESKALDIAAATLDMSKRQYVRRAINNQIRMDELARKGLGS